MIKKTGDVPAWLNIVGAALVALFAGGAAWGAASLKLREVDELSGRVLKIEKAMCALVMVSAAEVALSTPERLPLMGPAMEACTSK